MSLKLKVLGLGLLAVLAMSALANASVKTGGHFVSTEEHTILEGVDEPEKTTKLIDHHAGKTIECKKDPTYTGTISSATKTATQIDITPNYETAKECVSSGFVAHVEMTGCVYRFTVAPIPAAEDSTVHLACEAGKEPHVRITTAFGTCNVTFTAGTYTGVVLKNLLHPTKHAVTAEVTISGIHAIYTGGAFVCGVAEGTTSTTATLVGSAIITGFNTAGGQVSITAT
jgi:hypothetical protein